jgi:sarcosine oxidase subunit alpha
LSFAANDLPGVPLLASAVRDYVVNFGVSTVIGPWLHTNNDGTHRTAIILKQAGLDIQSSLMPFEIEVT